ncbi:MAG: hypothetical protein JWS10_2712 [Cypionkella sp.]|nr:hypothetical protein [Cypionkella sp.]
MTQKGFDFLHQAAAIWTFDGVKSAGLRKVKTGNW